MSCVPAASRFVSSTRRRSSASIEDPGNFWGRLLVSVEGIADLSRVPYAAELTLDVTSPAAHNPGIDDRPCKSTWTPPTM